MDWWSLSLRCHKWLPSSSDSEFMASKIQAEYFPDPHVNQKLCFVRLTAASLREGT